MISGAAEQKCKRRRRRVQHAKFDCRRGDRSERNHRRSLGSSSDACYCERVKIGRDDGDDYNRNQQHSDEFEPAIHGELD